MKNTFNILIIYLLLMIFTPFQILTSQEVYYGNYYSCYHCSDTIEAFLHIDAEGFAIFCESISSEEDVIYNDIVLKTPNFAGNIEPLSDSTLLLCDTLCNSKFAVLITDSLLFQIIYDSKKKLQNMFFIRYTSLYPQYNIDSSLETQYIIKWSYNKFGFPIDFIDDSDNYFYFYDRDGGLLRKVEDSAHIHPEKRF